MSSAARAAAAPRRAPFRFWHEAILMALLAALLIGARVVAPDFVLVDTQRELLLHVWETALLTLPMTLIIITGGIDLSVGSAMALCAVVLGLAHEAGVPPFAATSLALAAGLAAGALNGLFVSRAQVHPLLVTLATLAAFRGVAEGVSRGRPISGFGEGFTALARQQFLGIPAPAVIFILCAVLAAVVLARTPLGLSLYAIGHNETASRYSGIRVDRIKLLLYSLSGLAAGLAAVLFVARRNTAKADVGQGIELEVIAMVVLGGTSIFGGRGSIFGTLLGILLIHETREFVSWHWNRDELNLIVLGILLILSVLLHRFVSVREREAS
uniref:Autoinducer 2 import system permease protein LsrD n=1 Tax=uncultured Armatimonadetes bacterium TaxID=157466 RepID=A0A6J4I6A4_9BACT|nr:hypothetical protein AVDCRST_MAG63-1444 [uncultured Armatimonadetes bacterium]